MSCVGCVQLSEYLPGVQTFFFLLFELTDLGIQSSCFSEWMSLVLHCKCMRLSAILCCISAGRAGCMM